MLVYELLRTGLIAVGFGTLVLSAGCSPSETVSNDLQNEESASTPATKTTSQLAGDSDTPGERSAADAAARSDVPRGGGNWQKKLVVTGSTQFTDFYGDWRIPLMFAGAGRILLTQRNTRTNVAIEVWDYSSGRLLNLISLAVPAYPGRVYISPDAKSLVYSWDRGFTRGYTAVGLTLIDLQTYEVAGMASWVRSGGRFSGPTVTFSPDCTEIAVTGTYAVERYRLALNSRPNDEPGSGLVPIEQRLQHESYARCAAYAPSGTFLISGGEDGIRRWELPTGKLLGHVGPNEKRKSWSLWSLSIDARGERLAHTLDGRAIVRSTSLEVPVSEPAIGEAEVRDVAFAPAGNRLLTLDRKGDAWIWDTTGTPVAGSEKFEGVTGAVWRADGQALALGHADGKVVVLERDGEHTVPVEHTSIAQPVLIESLPAKPLRGADFTLKLDGRPLLEGISYEYKVAPAGEWLPVEGAHLTLQAVDTDNVDIHLRAVSPSGQRSSVLRNTWDVARNPEWISIRTVLPGSGQHFSRCAVSPDDRLLASVVVPTDRSDTRKRSASVVVFDIQSGAPISRWTVGLSEYDYEGSYVWLAFSPNGRSLVARRAEGGFTVFEAATGKVQKTIEMTAAIRNAAVDTHEQMLAVFTEGSIELYSTEMWQRLETIEAGPYVEQMAFCAPGELVLGDYELSLANAKSGVQGRKDRLTKHAGPITATTFSGDGNIAASIALDGTRIWRVSDARLLHLIPRIAAASFMSLPGKLALDHAGELLAVAEPVGVQVVRVIDGVKIATLEAPEAQLLFSRDGRLVVMRSDRISVWEQSSQ